MTESNGIRIGELASASGLTVRTLHHYDAIGLLRPSRRVGTGRHRLYLPRDVERLVHIRALVQLGMSLDAIGRVLDGGTQIAPLATALEELAVRLDERVAEAMRLRSRLAGLRERLVREDAVSVGEFLEALQEMTMFEKYYTPEQLAQLERRRDELGEDAIRAVQAEWPRLIAAVRDEMDRGTPPDDPRVQALARRWHELVEMFTGGDPGIRESLRRLYANEPRVGEQHGIDPELSSYVAAARAPQ